MQHIARCQLSTTGLIGTRRVSPDSGKLYGVLTVGVGSSMMAWCQGGHSTPLTRCHAVPLHRSQLHSVRSASRSLQSATLPRCRPTPRHYALRAAGNGDPAPGRKQRSDSAAAVTGLDPAVALGGSWVAYGSLIIAAQAFRLPGAPSVLEQLQAPWSPLAALLFLAPLVAALAFAETQADRFPALAEIRDLLADTVLPLLQNMQWWERSLLALSAGLGEEVFFRGFMQSSIAAKLADLGSVAAQPAAISITSVIFGALHAVTPLYFLVATVAGALFGGEYLVGGLTAAVFTHSVYDWIAFETTVLLANREQKSFEDDDDP